MIPGHLIDDLLVAALVLGLAPWVLGGVALGATLLAAGYLFVRLMDRSILHAGLSRLV